MLVQIAAFHSLSRPLLDVASAADEWVWRVHLEVVRSALGKQAKAPENADVIEKGLATMQANWYWFLLAVIPLALAVLMGAVGLGVSRSSEWLFKLVVALVGVIAFAPAFVA